ncbi:MAG: L-2-amino-thiazoline-4-carboxylic acid hydrolase [Chloroflexi bacterium]|nr:L-2-amino-thiazoline-4-carboxylic acid hydrolase [Chloroflexota bacterium]
MSDEQAATRSEEEQKVLEELEKVDMLYEIDRLETQSAVIFAKLMEAYIDAFGEEVLDIGERLRWETGVRIGNRMSADFEEDPAAGLDKHFTQAWTQNAAWSRFCICEYPVTEWGRFETRALRCVYGHAFHRLKAEKIGLAYCAIDVGIAEGCHPRMHMYFEQCMHKGDPCCYQVREILDEPQELRLRSEEYGWRSMRNLPRVGISEANDTQEGA